MSKHYLDRKEFHNELAICKKKGDLTPRALEMFQCLSENCSRDFFFEREADRDDAVQNAMHDLFKYWRNFKESNIVQLKINRQPQVNEFIKVKIHIPDGEDVVLKYRASPNQTVAKRAFRVDKTINYTIANVVNIVKEIDNKYLEIFHDKIQNKITLMDKYNGDDLSVKSSVTVHQKLVETLVEDKKPNDTKEDEFMEEKKKPEMVKKKILLVNDDKKTGNVHWFKKPPNAFSYFTSITRRGILKSINKVNPPVLRNGNKISMDQINRENNGMYNF